MKFRSIRNSALAVEETKENILDFSQGTAGF